MKGVVLLSKRGCHLCEAVESEIRSMGAGLEVVDIGDSGELHDKYWLRVPVVMVDGREAFEAKMMDLAGGWKHALARTLGQAR